ncbi:uncharacterized protein LOC108033696 isoform X2 [Drosophila biarmipes]|uniref:uncharacterized protein LOC108033696 isoform X2 n=1 Tax=Drosophila biarmipes TaxID=125945 RepID=UPI0021CC8E61|nr:uncharacterized protein LOC108033696 isoform X2 [Drosophila biarmipes]
MTSLECVFVAGLCHVMHYLAWSSKRSDIPRFQLPSLIVGLAAMDLIWDNCFIPRRLQIMPAVLKRVYELAVAFILLEIAVHVIWKAVERGCFFLIKRYCAAVLSGPSICRTCNRPLPFAARLLL